VLTDEATIDFEERSTGFHPHAHLLSSARQLSVECFRRFPMLESLLVQFPSFCIDKGNLLEARMVIAPYQ
jgi:hypothetical protein